MSATGYRRELPKLAHYIYELVFGVASVSIQPLNRQSKAESLPVLFQGRQPLCVPFSVLWVSNWWGWYVEPKEAEGKLLDALNACGELDNRGSLPSQVLDQAKRLGIIPGYYWLQNLGEATLMSALEKGPLLVGLIGWPLVPDGHFMVLLERKADGSWLCVNWANEHRTDFVTLPPETVFDCAVLPYAKPEVGVAPRLVWFEALIWKLTSFFHYAAQTFKI